MISFSETARKAKVLLALGNFALTYMSRVNRLINININLDDSKKLINSILAQKCYYIYHIPYLLKK